jgi:predicted O-linked N-acetylglucosamine transferase (SPINDLY family)
MQQGRQALAKGAVTPALAAYRRAHQAEPLAEEPLATLCHLLDASGQPQQALPFARVLHEHPYPPRAKRHAGMVFLKLNRPEDAHACFLAARPLEHQDATVVAYLNNTAMRLADWATARRCQRFLAQRYRDGDFRSPRENPFHALGWCPRDDWNRRLAAYYWARRAPAAAQRLCPEPPAPLTSPSLYKRRPLRVGYLSADWKQHATLELMIGVLEQHDPAACDITLYCYSRDDGSALRQRLIQAVPRRVDLNGLDDAQAAARIRADRLDILVDCKGFTQGSRSQILGYRPAPLQINWLAYPGSLGSDVHDYLIGDPYVTPPGCEPAFSEAIYQNVY